MDYVISIIAIMSKFILPLGGVIIILILMFCWTLRRRHKQVWDGLFPDSIESGRFLETFGNFLDEKFEELNDKLITRIGRLINYLSWLFCIMFGIFLFTIFVWPFLSTSLKYLFPSWAPYL